MVSNPTPKFRVPRLVARLKHRFEMSGNNWIYVGGLCNGVARILVVAEIFRVLLRPTRFGGGGGSSRGFRDLHKRTTGPMYRKGYCSAIYSYTITTMCDMHA